MKRRNGPGTVTGAAPTLSDHCSDHPEPNTRDRQAASDLDEYVRHVLGNEDGILAVSYGTDPYRDDGGIYRHREFKNQYYPLPTGLDKLRRDVEATSGKPIDVYVCAAVRTARNRRKGTAKQPLTWLWADLDRPTDEALLAKLNPLLVESGTPGHLHAYIRLSEPVGLDDWQLLQTALRDRLDGDDKIADNDLLRLPGTWNHKTDPPSPVRCRPGTAKAWNPNDLAAVLLDEDAPPEPVKSSERPPDPLPHGVRDALTADVDDRSKAHHRLVRECWINGLTLGQTLAVVSDYQPSQEKYEARLGEEVARSWTRIEAESVTDQPPAATSTTCGPNPDHMSGGGGGGVPLTVVESRESFGRWLGKSYDIEAHDVLLCALAASKLDGDPLWLLYISGSGNAKTETVQAAAGITGVIVTSTIASEGALLSATPTKEKTKNATGGLLRKLGERGVLVIKDVTSILSMSREMRNSVLAAIREIHDGYWARNVGTDGGRTLDWKGHVTVIGAVTTAWDRAHDVIAAMGDRFVLLRMDSTNGRQAAGRQAIANTGREVEMRDELSKAVAGVLAGLDSNVDKQLTPDEEERLIAAANLVTLARTGVDYDYQGNVIDAHAPEMPTRFTKQLTQLVRGGLTLGFSRDHAMHLAIRCARDSMPPLRLLILLDVASHPDSTTTDVRNRTNKPRATVDRQLQALQALGLLDCYQPVGEVKGWRYSLCEGLDLTALDPGPSPDLSVQVETGDRGGEECSPMTSRTPPDKSGDGSRAA